MSEPHEPRDVAAPLPGDRPVDNVTELVDRYLDRVYRFLMSMTGDAEMARDLTQETFLKLQGALQRSSFRASPTAYVFATARNAAISLLRRRGLEGLHISLVPPEEIEAFAERSGGSDPGRRLELSELRAALRRAVGQLPEKLRAAFLLSEVEGLCYAEIGKVLGCSEGTVASRKHNAVRQLRRALGEAYDAL